MALARERAGAGKLDRAISDSYERTGPAGSFSRNARARIAGYSSGYVADSPGRDRARTHNKDIARDQGRTRGAQWRGIPFGTEAYYPAVQAEKTGYYAGPLVAQRTQLTSNHGRTTEHT